MGKTVIIHPGVADVCTNETAVVIRSGIEEGEEREVGEIVEQE